MLPILLFQACDLINPKEEIPSYIHIPSLSLAIDSPAVQGSASSEILDAWVTVNNEFTGVFELPATFPVLQEGKCNVSIRAGIKENGIYNTRVPYPFYLPVNRSVDLESKEIDSLKNLQVHYAADTKFPVSETFEDTNDLAVINTSNANVPFSVTQDPGEVFEGTTSLKATLTQKQELFEITLRDEDALNLQRGKPFYLELNYKTDIQLAVGLIVVGQTSQGQKTKLYLNPTDGEWKKIYVNFTNNITRYRSGVRFKFFIGAYNNEDNTTNKLYLDNLKLVNFE